MLLHAGHADSATPLLLRWGAEPGVALALALTATGYALGVQRAWRRAGPGHAVRRGQVWSFAIGLAVVVLALCSPIDALSDDLFAAHMVQHVLLATVAPPFLVAGAPLVALLWALPDEPRRRVALRVRRARGLQAAWAALTAPALAWLLHAVAIWAWHLPRLYTLALREPAAHALEHLSFVGTAVLLWWGILHPRMARRSGYAVGILTVFATAMQTGALGALLTLSHRAWYPVHAAGAAAWGLTLLEDQQLAGLVMWVPGGLLYVVAMSVLFVGWLDAGPRHDPVAAPRLVPEAT